MTSYRLDINPDDPESIRRALNTEWLLTNGLGGYAMGTALGVNTRRYHGLLVAATKPPVGRFVALHSMIEQLILPREDGTDEVIDLSTHQFVGGNGEPMLHPNGWRHLVRLEHDDRHISWVWNVRGMSIHKSLSFTSWDMYVHYMFYDNRASCRIRLRPFLPMRDFHALAAPIPRIHWQPNMLIVNNVLRVHGLAGIEWHNDSATWNRFAYSADRNRGQDWVEDVHSPGFFESKVAGASNHAGFALFLIGSDDVLPAKRGVSNRDVTGSEDSIDARSMLTNASEHFVVTRWMGEYPFTSIIAGYPWFGDWGRDTMISLPGLLLCTGRLDEARETLLTFARNLRNGLIPNLFDDYGGGAHYNSVDASLWFVYAVYQLWQAAADPIARAFPSPSGRGVRGEGVDGNLIAACREIIAAYRSGTEFNIRMEPDGLIAAGDKNSQLTWMDAKRDGVVFTPRHGKAVEINALWFNALRCMAEMTNDDRERHELMDLSVRVAASFREQFWWNAKECLHDVLLQRGDQFIPDGRLRPNQVFAVSLPFSPLNEVQQRAVVKIVGDRLLTPFGLRTLDRDDPGYKPRYEGNLFQRDAAYHNGTVWPWLIGPYCEALLRIEHFSADAKVRVRKLIQPLIDEMSNTSGGRCLGQIPEVYDGDPPHNPGGCPAQAWSVAEVLRVLMMVEPESLRGPAT